MPRWETLLAFAIAGLVLAFRFSRMAKERPLHPRRLWILPPLLLLILIATIIAAPPPLWGYGVLAIALAIGGVIGWHRGKMIDIRRDGDSFVQKASPVAMLLLAGAIALKVAVRQFTDSPNLPDAGARHSATAIVISTALLGFMVALVSATRVEMALRCKRIKSGDCA